eukprot:791144-Pleurochrysis_carterae.AAC.1
MLKKYYTRWLFVRAGKCGERRLKSTNRKPTVNGKERKVSAAQCVQLLMAKARTKKRQRVLIKECQTAPGSPRRSRRGRAPATSSNLSSPSLRPK